MFSGLHMPQQTGKDERSVYLFSKRDSVNKNIVVGRFNKD
jgi:hypothetical protein